MNFNLISPEENGYQFNVRYKEPIIISPNSSVQLNWASFERDTTFEFTEDQFIQFSYNSVLPYKEPQNNNVIIGVDSSATANSRTDRNRFYINKGTYDLTSLQTAITNSLVANPENNNRFLGSYQNDRDLTIGALPANNNKTLKADLYDCISPRIEINPSGLKIGFNVNHSRLANGTLSFNANTFHQFNTSLATDPEEPDYLATADGQDVATPDNDGYREYDNSYVVCNDKYFHLGADLRQYEASDISVPGRVCSGFDELKDSNMATFLCSHKLSDLQGSVGAGLYCMEKMDGGLRGANVGSASGQTLPLVNPGGHDRPGGTNQQPIYNAVEIRGIANEKQVGGIPRCYFWVEINGNTHCSAPNRGTLAIYEIYSKTSLEDPRSILNAGSAANEYAASLVQRVRLIDYMEDTNYPMFGIQTYKKDKSLNDEGSPHFLDNTDLYVRVCLFSTDGSAVIVYDSDWYKPKGEIIFPSTLFTHYNDDANVGAGSGGAGAGGAYTTNELEVAYRSQVHFNWLCSATTTGEGFWRINSKSYELARNTNLASCMIEEYNITMSKQLASLINPTRAATYTLPPKFPSYAGYDNGILYYQNKLNKDITTWNNDDSDMFYCLNQIIAQYRSDKFSILINGLPIKVYKNTNDKNVSGSQKNILANIPNAFQGADIFVASFQGKVLGTFQSSLGVINQLGNQLHTTNNFDIKVINMEDETPATQLTKTIINFTIYPPN